MYFKSSLSHMYLRYWELDFRHMLENVSVCMCSYPPFSRWNRMFVVTPMQQSSFNLGVLLNHKYEVGSFCKQAIIGVLGFVGIICNFSYVFINMRRTIWGDKQLHCLQQNGTTLAFKLFHLSVNRISNVRMYKQLLLMFSLCRELGQSFCC